MESGDKKMHQMPDQEGPNSNSHFDTHSPEGSSEVEIFLENSISSSDSTPLPDLSPERFSPEEEQVRTSHRPYYY
jgi:hypothetical protein